MFDLGFAELLVIGITALIVVGPKDLPGLFRNVGRFMGKARGMAREFSRAMNDAADSAGVKDVQNTLKSATNPIGSAMESVKHTATKAFDPTSSTGQNSGNDTGQEMGQHTGQLSAEREAARKKIEAGAARAQAERKQREAAEALKRAEALESSLAEDASKAAQPQAGAQPAPAPDGQTPDAKKEDKA